VAREGTPLRIRCDVSATWKVGKADRVTISVPQSCIKDNAGRLAMGLGIGPPGSEILDQTRFVYVGRS
jgi:hypothetical protein